VKEGIQWHIEGRVSSGFLANVGFSGFLNFFSHVEAAATLAMMTLHTSSRWDFSYVG
jgi:hypothetical protein